MKFRLHITQTIEKLLAQEDTDGDKKITIDDNADTAIKYLHQGQIYISKNGKKYTILGLEL